MDKNFEDAIETRCDSVLQNNAEYLILQKKLADAHDKNDIDTFAKISYQMQIIAVIVSYGLGIKDIYNIIK